MQAQSIYAVGKTYRSATITERAPDGRSVTLTCNICGSTRTASSSNLSTGSIRGCRTCPQDTSPPALGPVLAKAREFGLRRPLALGLLESPCRLCGKAPANHLVFAPKPAACCITCEPRIIGTLAETIAWALSVAKRNPT